MAHAWIHSQQVVNRFTPSQLLHHPLHQKETILAFISSTGQTLVNQQACHAGSIPEGLLKGTPNRTYIHSLRSTSGKPLVTRGPLLTCKALDLFKHTRAKGPEKLLCRKQSPEKAADSLGKEDEDSVRGRSKVPNGGSAWPEKLEVGPDDQGWEVRSSARDTGGTIDTLIQDGAGVSNNGRTADWFPLDPVWQASEQEALSDTQLRHLLAPPWRVLLLSDGSVTRHLQLLSDFGSVTADCFQMEEIGETLDGLPPGVELVPGPRVQRQVWLRTSDGQPLVYAASWWSAQEVKGYLKEVQKPIWVNLSQTRAELYRDVQRLYLGHSKELERVFGAPGPFWARHYVFYHNGRPLTLIYEVFSRSLEQYIGPMQPDGESFDGCC